MRTPRLLLLTLALVTVASSALAQATSPYDISWSALDPGNDWAAQVIRSLFPIPGATPGPTAGSEATAITQIVAQFTGFVAAIAVAFVTYNVIMNIHRAAETSHILGTNQSFIFVVRVGFAAIMMFPLGGGFSAGQALVMQGALTGIGMAKALYASAIQAIGPDALVIPPPAIPGTAPIVAGLVDSELCMDLVNLASGTTHGESGPLVPIPQPVQSPGFGSAGGYIAYYYGLATGDGWGNPACGTVRITEPAKNQTPVAGVNLDMASVQQALLQNVLNSSIRNQVASVAQNLWQTKQASALTPLQDIYSNAVNTYTTSLITAATSIQSALNAAIQANTQQGRTGNVGLLQGEVQQSTLGWTGAGAYYLEIARLNASTLSLLSNTPVTTSPTYEGLGPALSEDLAPLEAAQKDFMNTLDMVVQTQDGTHPPSGAPKTLADAKDAAQGQTVLTRLFNSMNISNGVLSSITQWLTPTTQIWTDPFGGLMNLGQTLINTALIGMGTAAVLSSGTTSTGLAVWNFLTGDWAASAAAVAGHALMSFLGVPIFAGLLAILVPGLIIAYVLPMIPWVMWMAGVAGWIILVCEAMIAVPLWMLAHMTFGGDGLHGRGIEGWGLLFNVVFRPTLMVIGLFLAYFVFDCMSWLIRETFGIAAGFTLQNGWIVTNFVGLGVLLTIFAMMHVVAALMSFRMVALLPHHLPRLIGFTAANRVDMDDFQQRAAWGPGGMVAGSTARAIGNGTRDYGKAVQRLQGGAGGYISGPEEASGEGGGMDSTLSASSQISPTAEGDDDV